MPQLAVKVRESETRLEHLGIKKFIKRIQRLPGFLYPSTGSADYSQTDKPRRKKFQ